MLLFPALPRLTRGADLEPPDDLGREELPPPRDPDEDAFSEELELVRRGEDAAARAVDLGAADEVRACEDRAEDVRPGFGGELGPDDCRIVAFARRGAEDAVCGAAARRVALETPLVDGCRRIVVDDVRPGRSGWFGPPPREALAGLLPREPPAGEPDAGPIIVDLAVEDRPPALGAELDVEGLPCWTLAERVAARELLAAFCDRIVVVRERFCPPAELAGCNTDCAPRDDRRCWAGDWTGVGAGVGLVASVRRNWACGWSRPWVAAGDLSERVVPRAAVVVAFALSGEESDGERRRS